jgi:hypothetical protein
VLQSQPTAPFGISPAVGEWIMDGPDYPEEALEDERQNGRNEVRDLLKMHVVWSVPEYSPQHLCK